MFIKLKVSFCIAIWQLFIVYFNGLNFEKIESKNKILQHVKNLDLLKKEAFPMSTIGSVDSNKKTNVFKNEQKNIFNSQQNKQNPSIKKLSFSSQQPISNGFQYNPMPDSFSLNKSPSINKMTQYNSVSPDTVNQMNQINTFNPSNGFNPLSQLIQINLYNPSSIGAMNPTHFFDQMKQNIPSNQINPAETINSLSPSISQINQLNSADPTNSIKQLRMLNAINPMSSINSMNQLNSFDPGILDSKNPTNQINPNFSFNRMSQVNLADPENTIDQFKNFNSINQANSPINSFPMNQMSQQMIPMSQPSSIVYQTYPNQMIDQIGSIYPGIPYPITQLRNPYVPDKPVLRLNFRRFGR